MPAQDRRFVARPDPAFPPAILTAYLKAGYRVGPPDQGFVLSIGEPSLRLRSLLEEGGFASLVGLSAYHPHSRLVSARANEEAHARLVLLLRAAHSGVLEGENSDPEGIWPPEKSLWVPDMGLEEGLALARGFGQNALVYCASDAVPLLAFC